MTQEKIDLFERMVQAAVAINETYMPTVRQFIEANEINGMILARCQIAQSAAPEPVTLDAFVERDPYSHPDNYLQSLAEVAEAGYLTAVSPHVYTLTANGQALAEGVQEVTKNAGADVTLLPSAAMAQLESLLQRIVTAIEASDAPQACLRRSRFFDPGVDAPVVERIRRYLNDLNAYRDDAHQAAWQELNVAGPAWEAFSHIWGENIWGDPVSTAAEIGEKLGFRGYDVEAYADFLQPLLDAGWLTLTDGKYALTENGRRVRAQVEAKTDDLFYGAWPLDADELATLETLLVDLAASSQSETETAAE